MTIKDDKALRSLHLPRPGQTKTRVWLLLFSQFALLSVTAAGDTWPAWRSAMKSGTWTAIPATNTITAIDPAKNSAFNPNLPGNTSAPWSGALHIGGVINPWCGGTFDEATDTLWLPLGGGHQDYAGNEAYRITLGTAAPAWSSPRPPSGSIPLGLITLNDGKETSGDYSDGRPRAIHSYNKHVFVPGVGNILAMQGSTYLSGQAGTSRTLLLNSTTGEWSHLSTHPAPGVEYGGACYDSLRHRIWWLPSAQGYLSYFDLATNTWTVLASSTYLDEWSYTRPLYIPGKDVIVQLQKNLTGNIGVWNLATAQRATPGTTNAPPASVSNLGSAGFAWVPALNAFCLWGNTTATTTIHTLSPPTTGDWKTQPWTWGTLTLDPTNTVVPTVACTTGTYGRFGYSPNLNGFFLLNAVNQPVYFYALGDGPAGGIVAPGGAIITITVE